MRFPFFDMNQRSRGHRDGTLFGVYLENSGEYDKDFVAILAMPRPNELPSPAVKNDG